MGGANLGGAKVGRCGFFFTELAITDDGCGGNGGRGPTLSPDRLLSNNEIVVKNSVQPIKTLLTCVVRVAKLV